MRLNLDTYQQLNAITEDKSLSDLDKGLFSICAVYGLSEEQLDSYTPKRVLKMANRVNKLFAKPLKLNSPSFISLYRINYAIENITFGQYIELVFFTKNNDVLNKAQYIVATMARTFYDKQHVSKANYFAKCEADKIIGAAICIKSNFDNFNSTKFKHLFEPYPEMYSDNSPMGKWFGENFGWFFSAKSVADFEGITLEEAYKLPVQKALNDLMFLKAKGRYDFFLTHKND